MTIPLSAILPLLIAFSGLSFGTIFIFIGWCLWYPGRYLRTKGLTVTATVLEKFQREDQALLGKLDSCYVRCAFQDTAGKPHEVEVSMHSKQWYLVSEGATTQLTYVPNDPDETQPGSRFAWQMRGITGITLMGFGLLMIAVVSVSGFQQWLRATQTV